MCEYVGTVSRSVQKATAQQKGRPSYSRQHQHQQQPSTSPSSPGRYESHDAVNCIVREAESKKVSAQISARSRSHHRVLSVSTHRVTPRSQRARSAAKGTEANEVSSNALAGAERNSVEKRALQLTAGGARHTFSSVAPAFSLVRYMYLRLIREKRREVLCNAAPLSPAIPLPNMRDAPAVSHSPPSSLAPDFQEPELSLLPPRD